MFLTGSALCGFAHSMIALVAFRAIQGIGASFVPGVLNREIYDEVMGIRDEEALAMTRRLAREEGIFCGVSAGGAAWAALQLSRQVENAVIVTIICDRGDRYLSTGVFPD